MPSSKVWPGQPYPLGATWDGKGVNFALFSAHADKVELCLFDSSGQHEEARIALILDVVYNHTGEGNHLGPTLSFRGIDNLSYYRLDNDRRRYRDVTGCGNTLNTDHPRVLQLVLDSLRYWALEMHVDGFRFDLAPALARENGEYSQSAAFFDAIRQDPAMSLTKLIAEPWDVGDGGE